MTSFSRHMKQTATYWAKTGTDTYGKPTFSAPATMQCRWEDRTQVIMNKGGKEIVSKARVFLADDISEEGFLYLGTSVAASPIGISGAYEIQAVGRQPDLRAVKTLHVAHL